MKRATFWLFLIVVAAAGFVIGRMSGNAPLPSVNVHQEFPLLPAPPKTDGYQTLTAAQPERDLIVEVPVEGAEVSGEFLDIAGRAKAGRQSIVLITVKLADGSTLVSTESRIEGAQVGSYGRFGATLPLPQHEPGPASIELTLRTDGQVTATETRPFAFAEPNTVPVKVYFGQKEAESLSCDVVHPVDRLVSSKVAVYRAVIEDLLKGPSAAEKGAGYYTSIPSGVALKSVAADAQGVVTADFSDALDRGVAGSCRVTHIRSQIFVTLKQFPEVRDVVISINGRTEDILQP